MTAYQEDPAVLRRLISGLYGVELHWVRNQWRLGWVRQVENERLRFLINEAAEGASE